MLVTAGLQQLVAADHSIKGQTVNGDERPDNHAIHHPKANVAAMRLAAARGVQPVAQWFGQPVHTPESRVASAQAPRHA
jgi:hypothetical protein